MKISAKKLLSVCMSFILCFSMFSAITMVKGLTKELNVTDAIKVLRYSAGTGALTQDEQTLYDVDFNGLVNISDAIIVLRVAAGLMPLPIKPTNQTVMYSLFPTIPDFGACANATLDETISGDPTIYLYSLNFSSSAISDYSDLLIANGFHFDHSFKDKDGTTVLDYENTTHSVLLAVAGTQFAVMIFNGKFSDTNKTVMYTPFQDIPDFGAFANATLYAPLTSIDIDSADYIYSSGFDSSEIASYCDLLIANGFALASTFTDDYGKPVWFYFNGTNTVMLMYFRTYFCVSIM